jgi:hypothetical protein
MPVIKVQTTVVGYLLDADVWLENQQINLSHDGNKTWQSTDLINVNDGVLNVVFHGRGVAGTDWGVVVSQLAPAKKELIKDGGTIQANGHSLVPYAAPIA